MFVRAVLPVIKHYVIHSLFTSTNVILASVHCRQRFPEMDRSCNLNHLHSVVCPLHGLSLATVNTYRRRVRSNSWRTLLLSLVDEFSELGAVFSLLLLGTLHFVRTTVRLFEWQTILYDEFHCRVSTILGWLVMNANSCPQMAASFHLSA